MMNHRQHKARGECELLVLLPLPPHAGITGMYHLVYTVLGLMHTRQALYQLSLLHSSVPSLPVSLWVNWLSSPVLLDPGHTCCRLLLELSWAEHPWRRHSEDNSWCWFAWASGSPHHDLPPPQTKEGFSGCGSWALRQQKLCRHGILGMLSLLHDVNQYKP